jgi:mono/diheme cytochrome c family protein
MAVALLAALGLDPGAAQPRDASSAPFVVHCAAEETPSAPRCAADVRTFVGARVFRAHCASCHGDDAEGSAFAPNLTERMRGMDMRRFFAALDEGYLGPHSTEAPRGRDPGVAPYYNELWAYLRARVDGALPAGPVGRLPAETPTPAE